MTSDNGNVDASSTSQPKPFDSKTKTKTKTDTDNLFDFYIVATGCLIYMGVAIISFYFVIHQFYGKKTNKFLDACYSTIVLMTSSGYKDLTPYSNLAIVLTIFFAIMGIAVFGAPMSLGADLLLVTKLDNKKFLDSVKNCKTVQYPSGMKKRWKVLAVMLAVHIFVGTPLLAFIGNMAFFRALYCVSSTITTVLNTGKCFSTKARRIIALFWIFYGMITSSCVLYIFSEARAHRSKWLFLKRNPALLQDLKSSDLDDDGFVRLPEYILCKLKEKQRLRGEKEDVTMEDVQRFINKMSGLKNVDTYAPRMEHSNGGNQDSSITPPPKPSFKFHILKLHNLDDIRYIIIFFVIYLVSSTVIFYVVRNHISGKRTNSFLDAVYFSFVIMTSVGYGDLSPDDDPLALIFASLFSLLGLFVIGLVLSMALQVLDIQQEDIVRKNDANEDQTTAAKESKKVIRKKCIIIVVLFLIHMVVGTVILIWIEDLDFIHALYCISITITSAGSEKCFSTKLGRVFALVLMLLGAMYKSYVLFAFTKVYTEIKQRSRGRLRKNITPPKPKDSQPLKPAPPPKPKPDPRKPAAPPKPAPSPKADPPKPGPPKPAEPPKPASPPKAAPPPKPTDLPKAAPPPKATDPPKPAPPKPAAPPKADPRKPAAAGLPSKLPPHGDSDDDDDFDMDHDGDDDDDDDFDMDHDGVDDDDDFDMDRDGDDDDDDFDMDRDGGDDDFDMDRVIGALRGSGGASMSIIQEIDDDFDLDGDGSSIPLQDIDYLVAGVPTRIPPEDLIEEGMPTRLKDDIAAIMEEFRRLDVSGTGRLTLREVMTS